jgi:hypothetical protein
MKYYFIMAVNVLCMACMKSRTNVKIYNIVRNIEYFSVIVVVIREIESPIIKETNVVTLSPTDAKNRTLGNRQTPSNVYERKTGRN